MTYYNIRNVLVAVCVLAIVIGMVSCDVTSKNQEQFKINNCDSKGKSWAYDAHGRVYCEVK